MRNKKIILIVILIIILIGGVGLYLLINDNDTVTSDDKQEFVLDFDEGYSPEIIYLNTISNDISELDLKKNDRIDLYVVSETIDGKFLNEPLFANVRVYSVGEAVGAGSPEDRKYISVIIRDEHKQQLKAVTNIPNTAFVVKRSNQAGNEITVNEELVKEMEKHYQVVPDEEKTIN